MTQHPSANFSHLSPWSRHLPREGDNSSLIHSFFSSLPEVLPGLDAGQIRGLHAIAEEHDPALVAESLLQWGASTGAAGQADAAARVLAALIASPLASAPELRARVAARLQALRGEGAAGPRVEGWVRSFIAESTDPASLVACGVALRFGAFARDAVAARALLSGGSFAETRGARALVEAASVLSESLVFTAVRRGGHLLYRDNAANFSGLGSEWLQGAVFLLGIRAIARIGSGRLWDIKPRTASEAPRFSHLFDDFAGLSPAVASGRIEAAAGFRPGSSSIAPPALLSAALREAPAITVVGAGASGSLVASQLLKQAGLPVRINVVAGTRHPLSRGVAYSTADAGHRLNVPAEKMGAFPDALDDFLRWAQARGVDARPGQFLPRQLYGEYLREVLARSEAGRNPGTEFLTFGRDAVAIEPRGERAVVRLDSGEELPSDQVVLALGNAAPANLPIADPNFYASPFYTRDPFLRGGLQYLNTEGPVLLLGTGLTMVDAALSLAASGRASRILAISRQGRLPEVHAPAPPYAVAGEVAARYRGQDLRGLIATLRSEIARAEAGGSNWRAAIDALRPLTNELWAGLRPQEQRQWLRHLSRAWDIHRHRMPSESAAAIARLQAEGRLQVFAGRIEDLEAFDTGARLRFRPRGTVEPAFLDVAHVVNCTGPETNYLNLQRTNPLIRSLLEQRLAEPDPFRLGLQVDPEGRLLEPGGGISPFLTTLGPLRKGPRFWETTAVPEIRKQAATLAAQLLERISG